MLSGTPTCLLATINYMTDGTSTVSSIVDANGNSRNYSATDANHTKVTIKDPLNAVVYSYTAGFDANMSGTTKTNGANVIQATKTFASPNNPYRPSSMTNANSQTTNYTWDQYGNCLTKISPRSVTTTYTYSYANFVLGRLTSIQAGSKTPSSLTYFEPSGLINTITSPKPGTAGAAQTVNTSFTYDALGNVLTETTPGNNAVASMTTTYNYTTDGSYSQSAATRQALTRTDNLGHVTHMRYDSQANLTAVIDALGHETDLTYNIANQNVGIQFAATGETGTGRASFSNNFQYAGGTKNSESQSNESAVQVFLINYTHSAEGEETARSGSTQPYTATYDALYRPKLVSDGASHGTQMLYNAAGYAWKTIYPNGDVMQYNSFDNLGNPTQRQDGRGILTNYLYNDVESRLTDVQYPATPGINVHLHYDSYRRMDSMTDGSGSSSFTFDDMDSKLTNTTTYTGLAAKTLTTGYYPDGSRSSLTLPDSTTFSYQYDGAGRATQLTNPSAQVWTWTYLDNNWMSQQNANGQIITSPTRDNRGFITDLLNRRTDLMQTTLSDYAVGFAANLTLGSMTANIPGAPANFSGTNSYTHDAKLQLTQEASTRAGGYTNNQVYDGAGNPTTFKGVNAAFNSANQNTAYTHDGNGNPTTYKGSSLAYDAENRMTSFGSILTAGYRADGMRAWKRYP